MKTLEEKIINSKTIQRKSWISFAVFFVLIISCVFSWRWLNRQPTSDGALWPLRSVLNFNEKVFSAILNDRQKTKTFPLSAASPRVRVNGDAGMGKNFDAGKWKLQVMK